MTAIALRRGDSRTLTFAELAAETGETLTNFATGDVVRFTCRSSFAGGLVFLSLTSEDGGVSYTPGGTTGSVNIAPGDWAFPVLRALQDCPFDVERQRGEDVTTILSGTLTVRPDVTP